MTGATCTHHARGNRRQGVRGHLSALDGEVGLSEGGGSRANRKLGVVLRNPTLRLGTSRQWAGGSCETARGAGSACETNERVPAMRMKSISRM